MTKAILIEKIKNGKELFNSLLNELSDGHKTQSGVIADWSVKIPQRMLRWMIEKLKGGIQEAY